MTKEEAREYLEIILLLNTVQDSAYAEALRIAIDALEQNCGNCGAKLILCKNCKHFNDGDCTELPKICSENDFCSWAEKGEKYERVK